MAVDRLMADKTKSLSLGEKEDDTRGSIINGESRGCLVLMELRLA